MAKSKQSSQKREKEKGRQKKRQEKEERRRERKRHSTKGQGIDAIEVTTAVQDENIPAVQDNPVTAQPDKKDDIKIGKIVYLNEQKSYGFIRDARVKENVFFSTADLHCKVKLNDLVTFTRVKGARGSTATAIEKIG